MNARGINENIAVCRYYNSATIQLLHKQLLLLYLYIYAHTYSAENGVIH